MNGDTNDFDYGVKYGKIGEQIFYEDFVLFYKAKNINDVRDDVKYRKTDTDFIIDGVKYEVKLNYKDDGNIIIEDYTDWSEELEEEGKVVDGWVEVSKTDYFVFISKNTRQMIFVKRIPFVKLYKKLRMITYKTEPLEIDWTLDGIQIDQTTAPVYKYPLIPNKRSNRDGRYWRSAYRRIPLKDIQGYFKMFKLCQH